MAIVFLQVPQKLFASDVVLFPLEDLAYECPGLLGLDVNHGHEFLKLSEGEVR